MNRDDTRRVQEVLARLREAGATDAGIASATGAAHENVHGAGARSILVFTLAHPASAPLLDAWGVPGGTAGNREMEGIGRRIERTLAAATGISARLLPYAPGVFLKDAAALAGLGVIGKNNLLVTPHRGPRVRIRALLLDADLPPTGPRAFDPCGACDVPCRAACPEGAFRSGSYSRDRCSRRMRADERRREAGEHDGRPVLYVRYCRACEMACPVGRAG